MVNYQNGKIYKIVCNVTNKIYVGSTTKLLCQRLNAHKSNFKSYKNGATKFMTSYSVLENGNYDIILLLNYPCDNKEELHAKERYYIETIVCVNHNKPAMTELDIKQYKEVNKERINEQKRKYKRNNKDKTKQYNEDNKDKIREYQKNYRESKKIQKSEDI